MGKTKYRIARTLEAYSVSDDPDCDEAFEVETLEDKEEGTYDSVDEAQKAWEEWDETSEPFPAIPEDKKEGQVESVWTVAEYNRQDPYPPVWSWSESYTTLDEAKRQVEEQWAHDVVERDEHGKALLGALTWQEEDEGRYIAREDPDGPDGQVYFVTETEVGGPS